MEPNASDTSSLSRPGNHVSRVTRGRRSPPIVTSSPKYSNPLERHGTLLLQRLVQLSFAPPSYHHWMQATRTSINGYFTPLGAFESFRTFPLPNGYFLLSSIKMPPILSLYKYLPSLHTIHQKPSHLSLPVSLFLPLVLVRNGSRNEAVLEGASASPSTRIGHSNSQRAGSSGTSTDRGERIDCRSPGSLRAGSYHHGFSIRCLCSLSAIISWPIIPVIPLRLYYGRGCVWVCMRCSVYELFDPRMSFGLMQMISISKLILTLEVGLSPRNILKR